MKTKRALLPVLTGALLLTLGLAGCGAKPADGSKEGGQSNIPDTSAVEEEVKINVTAEGDKKELQVGETVQLHADQEGVEWGTRSPEIVSLKLREIRRRQRSIHKKEKRASTLFINLKMSRNCFSE